MNIEKYWAAVLKQDAVKMREFLDDKAYINWHDSNEHFTAEEYIRANCEYPGEWAGVIERVEEIGDLIVTAVNVFTTDIEMSFHVVSFIKLKDDKIVAIDEYWGAETKAPKWRIEKKLGTAIKKISDFTRKPQQKRLQHGGKEEK